MTRIHDRITVPGLCLFIHETQGSLCLSQTELTVVRRGCHFLRMPGLPMFSFPSPQGTLTASSSTDAVVYLTAMALGIVLLAGAWKQPMHKTRWPAFCWMALLLTVTCLTYASMFVQAELVVSGYCLCGVVVCTVGMFRAFRKATRYSRSSRQSYLIESLLTITTIVVVMFLLLPGMPHPHQASTRTLCRNNLKQIGLSFHNFADSVGRFPSSAGVLPGLRNDLPPMSWRVALLPQLELHELYGRYDDYLAWDSAYNAELKFTVVRPFHCPANPVVEASERTPFKTSYVVPNGAATIFGDGTVPALALDEITDGLSTTLLVVEACGSSIIWTEPRDVDTAVSPIGINLPGSVRGQSGGLASSYHAGGAQVLLADGSVRLLSQQIDPVLLQAMTTVAFGEPLDADDF